MLNETPGKLKCIYVPDYVVFDVETTGLSCQNDEIIELSAIKVRNNEMAEEFTSLVNPGKHISYQASQVNGITDKMVADAPFFESVLDDYIKFIGDLPLVGHNIHTFDLNFIYRDCKKYFGKVPDNDYIDTLKIAKMSLKELRHHKLTDLAAYYGISAEGAHRALNDCRMNQVVYEKLCHENVSNDGRVISCPECGSLMIKRQSSFGYFLGCGNYPECKHTIPLSKRN
ncbi:MAG: topoisomerase DNA-binding C4 zinc finger domain-containing protein [Lachnospiraceae bacterium]|nr:topoisomerase DNA-binding C4 zinc finger domain-containing protein [Lachnospiraceae bacterium]